MSDQITTAFVNQYSNNVYMLAQQFGSKLNQAVDVERVKGEKAFFDQIGATSVQQRASRHADTPLIAVPHSRRMVTMTTYDTADLIDDPDQVKTLIDPTNPYARSMAAAMGRQRDDLIISAARGTAYTGADGTSTQTLPSGQKVAVDFTGSNSDLNVEKVIEAKKILLNNDVDVDMEESYFVIAPHQLGSLLNTTEVTSSDYNTVKALVRGEIDTWMGFTFIVTTRLPISSNTRYNLAFVKSGIKVADGYNVTGKISERADKNYSTQVWYSMMMGSTRMEEEKVVEVACDESA
ncbi:MAG: hypothetical protein KGY38_07425 [Desulfobacterales bacterium]|nr:hypothetical protein [Desulfobacterales bacterium]